MSPDTARRTLVWLLRIFGVMMLTAVFAIFMPTDWMARVNDWLGLGPFPRAPLTEYLTRSLSAVFALLGALMLYVAADVERYLDFVGVVGLLTVLLGIFYLVLDLWAGMPASWTWLEGPPTAVLGVVLHRLARRAGAAT